MNVETNITEFLERFIKLTTFWIVVSEQYVRSSLTVPLVCFDALALNSIANLSTSRATFSIRKYRPA